MQKKSVFLFSLKYVNQQNGSNQTILWKRRDERKTRQKRNSPDENVMYGQATNKYSLRDIRASPSMPTEKALRPTVPKSNNKC
mgnify:CR=1 FL=1